MEAVKEKTSNLTELINYCVHHRFVFAIYRLPKSQEFTLIACKSNKPATNKIDFESVGSGFCIAPFDNTSQLPFFIQSDYILKFNLNGYLIEDNDNFLENIVLLNETLDKKFTIDLNETKIDSKKYESQVKSVLESINNGLCKKIVLSRKKTLGKIKGNNYFSGLSNLSEKYPFAFVSFVNLPSKNQLWMGASPEILVRQTSEGVFETVALAGTQNATDVNNIPILPKNALWTQKEIEEQAMVGRYIIDCLKKIRVREYVEEGPKTIKAGNLLHLCSTYKINSNDINFNTLSSVMLDLLHPTSAVCGMPMQTAKDVILNIEKYDREFYSGYLGPVNIENSSSIFVNLRTMKIENNEVFAYAGGGITEDSEPEKEWNETELKLKTILAAFDNL